MITPRLLMNPSRVLRLCVLPVMLCSMAFSQKPTRQELMKAEEDFYKHHPWPELMKPAGLAPPSRQPARLFTTQTHLDTASFSQYPADLTGVIVGNAQWIDYDNDGQLDIIVSGYDGSKPVTKIDHNDQGTFTDIGAAIPGIITERGIAWGDYDNDGDYDLAITGSLDSAGTMPVSKIFRNDNGTFVDINAPLMPLLGGVAKWVDYNLDGRLDLLIAGSPDRGSTFYTKLYRNDDSTFTDSGIFFPGVWSASVDWADYDNDGYPDLLLTGYGSWGVTSGIFRNEGGTDFTYVPLPFAPVNFSSVSWGDFDNDGKVDFVVSGDPPGWDNNTFTALYQNAGNDTFQLVPANLPQLNGSCVAWGDFDNDGDLDLAINGWHDDSTNVTKIFRNDGNGVFTDLGIDLPGTWWGSVAWGDFDNDGKLDLLISGGTTPQPFAAFYYGRVPWNPFAPITAIYHNNLPGMGAPPTPPSAPSAHATGNTVTFAWRSGTDEHTPQSMLTYNLRVGTSPGASDIVAPSSNLATGRLREPRVGNNYHKISRLLQLPPARYYWSVQTVNNAYAGSAFSEEQVFEPGNPPRWQLISVADTHADQHKTVLYPTAITEAYLYDQTVGYVAQPLLQNGTGYWLKFPTSDFPTVLAGGSVSSLVVPVIKGWNLIGSISSAVDVSGIASDPPGMSTSEFFGYNGGYGTVTTLESGRGYWVKASETGQLTLSSSATPAAGRIHIVPTRELPPLPPGEDVEGTPVPSGVPGEFTLKQNYPNPFNPATRIEFDLKQDALVSLTVYSMLGQKVATLADREEMKAGTNRLQFDGGSLPSGIYFYRIQASDKATGKIVFKAVRKMVLVK